MMTNANPAIIKLPVFSVKPALNDDTSPAIALKTAARFVVLLWAGFPGTGSTGPVVSTTESCPCPL